MRHSRRVVAAAIVALSMVGVAGAQQEQQDAQQAQDGQHRHGASMQVDKLVSRVLPTAGNQAHGMVVFTKEGDGVKVEAHIRGLEPNSTHGFHVHQYGDARSSDATSAGGHYNPEGHEHNLPPEASGGQEGQDQQQGQGQQQGENQQQGQGQQQGSQQRHAGDLGNIQADENGVAHKTFTVNNISLAGQKAPIIGRAVMVHAQRDTGQGSSGEAGSRIAMGIIGIANPEVESEMQGQGQGGGQQGQQQQ